MTAAPPVEITLRGVGPMDETVQHVRQRARSTGEDMGHPAGWAVLVEATWPRGMRVYRCTVAWVEDGRCIDAECADLDLFVTIDHAFAAIRRTMMERWGQGPQSGVHIRVRPGRRRDESTQTFRV